MKYTLADYYYEAGIEPSPPWAANIELRNPRTGDSMRPRWHQITGLKLVFAFENNRAGLYDDMGTGKTVVAQAWAIWHAWAGNRVVGMMPPILCDQFMRSLVKTFPGIEKHIRLGLYRGDVKTRNKKIAKWYPDNLPGITVTSYALFRQEFALFDSMLNCKVLLADEATPLCGTQSDIRDAIDRFMGPEGEKGALIMTGTPAKKEITDLYGLIKFVTPRAYQSQVEFERMHVKFAQITTKQKGRGGALYDRSVQIIDSVHDLAGVFEKLYLQARRVEKRHVLELKPVEEIERSFKLAPAHKDLYKKLVEEKLLFFPDGSMIDITTSSSVRATCMRAVSDPKKYLQYDEDSALLEALDELLDEINTSKKKVVMFAHYRETVELLAARYKHLKPVVIYGGIGTGRAAQNKETFIEDNKCRLLIANYVSGGVGLDGLQDVCHHAICVEPTPIPGDYAQARDRLHRSGQKESVFVYMMLALGTIYVKTAQTMWKRQDSILQATSVVSKDDLQGELLGDEDGEVEVDLED